jgi:hypothetical protein
MSVSSRRTPLVPLLPIMAVVLVAFLIIGLALPVLPLHVHQGLGLGTFMVGLVAGSQFAASLISRLWSGHYSDSRGAKHAIVAGLVMVAGAGLLYLLSLRFLGAPVASATILLLGRALLGGAESFIITGALSWGLALVEPRHTGKVIAWIGTAMYAAFALGAPIGTALYAGLWIPGDRAGHHPDAAGHAAPGRVPAPRHSPASRQPRLHEGDRRHLGARDRAGVQQYRLRGDHRLHFAALRRSRLEPGLACLQCLCGLLHGGSHLLRAPS